MFLILKPIGCGWPEHDIPLVVDNTFGGGGYLFKATWHMEQTL